MIYAEKCWWIKKIPPLFDIVEGHKLELGEKIFWPAKLLHFNKNKNEIAKIVIIKVKLMPQPEFSIQKLYNLQEKFIGNCDWKTRGQIWSLLIVISWSKYCTTKWIQKAV